MDDVDKDCFLFEYNRTKKYLNVILKNDEKNNQYEHIHGHPLFGYHHHIVLFFRLYLVYIFNLLFNHKDEYFVEDKDSYYFHTTTNDIQINRHYVNFIYFSFLFKDNDNREINIDNVYFYKCFDIFLDELNGHQLYTNLLKII